MGIGLLLTGSVARHAAIRWRIDRQMRARTKLREADKRVSVIAAPLAVEADRRAAWVIAARVRTPVIEARVRATWVRIAPRAEAEAIGLVIEACLAVGPEGPAPLEGVQVDSMGAEREAAALAEPRASAAEPAVAAAGGEYWRFIKQEEGMNQSFNGLVSRALATFVAGALCCILVSQARAQREAPKPSPGQRTFNTPQQAGDALIKAASNYDGSALREIFGPDGKDFVSSADPVRDKNQSEAFAAKAQERNAVVVDPENKDEATLSIGEEDWPFPVPIVKAGGKWFFDSKEGREEILFRRIGANELDAIQICLGFVEAQKEYASEIHDDSGVHQYAQRIVSTPGKRDGLVWKNDDGTLGGPIAEGIARAIEEGYSSTSSGYHGYYFKVLKGQGPAAPLGQLDYVIEGAMIGGFALAATPVEYRGTGVESFVVSYDGIVYQKDLGPDSLAIFKNMERYNPDDTWRPTDDQWPPDVAAAD